MSLLAKKKKSIKFTSISKRHEEITEAFSGEIIAIPQMNSLPQAIRLLK